MSTFSLRLQMLRRVQKHICYLLVSRSLICQWRTNSYFCITTATIRNIKFLADFASWLLFLILCVQFNIQRLSFEVEEGVETLEEAKRALQAIINRGHKMQDRSWSCVPVSKLPLSRFYNKQRVFGFNLLVLATEACTM